MKIREVIVVEGRDDIRAVSQAVEGTIVATHGYGFGQQLIRELQQAAKRRGVIIFTDPDYMGNEIRKRLDKAVPGCLHAYLAKDEATKDDDVGIENASPQAIREALAHARATVSTGEELFTMADLRTWKLAEAPGADRRRMALSKKLHLSYGNAKQWLKRLNGFGIRREELLQALQEWEAMEDRKE